MALLLVLSLGAQAAGKWKAYRSAPFTVYTTGGEREAREALNTLVQLRHVLSERFGKDLQPVWPVEIAQTKGGNMELRLVRETYVAVTPVGPLPTPLIEKLALLLIEENTAAMDPAMEKGVARVLSTIDCQGPRVTVGAAPAKKDLDWARMHLLLTDARYNGTSARVLLSNFAKGVDADAAWRNTLGKPQKEFDTEAKAHLAAGAPGTAAVSGKPFDARRIREEDLEPAEAALLEADIAGTPAAYRAAATKFPELHAAKEALGVLTGDKALLEGAAGPRALAALDTMDALEKAWKLNPRWSQPHEMLARHEAKQSDKAQRYRKAAELSPRQVRLWRMAAESFESAELQAEASKMWLAAERAALTQKERDGLRELRLAADRKRVDLEEAERRRVEEQERRELARLKNEALTRIREAESKANAGAPAQDPGRKVVDWWEGPKPDARVSGPFTRVDCLTGGKLRLHIAGKALLVRDPGQLVVMGSGTVDLGCGEQKPVRQATVEYLTKADKASGTIGEAATLQFAAPQ